MLGRNGASEHIRRWEGDGQEESKGKKWEAQKGI